MSQTIDQRIVEMRFDNQQFESGVQTSLNTLDKLNKTTSNLKDFKGLSGLEKAANTISLNGLQAAIDTINTRFSLMGEISTRVLHNIVDKAYAAGTALIKNLTIDPVKMGLEEYQTKIDAIQVIQSNTRGKNTMSDITTALDELNHYADKTIYNFAQMTSNIGKFTAQGLDVKQSADAVRGMANLAAASGASAADMSRATYQMSQALGGTIRKQDWNSLRNANMATVELKNTLIDLARVDKNFEKDFGMTIDEMIAKEGTFEETLAKGWLSGDRFTQAMNIYSDVYSEAELKAMGFNDEQVANFKDLAKMANDAATQVKTFKQLIDTTAESIQSGWTQTWEYIIGDFEQAKATLTEFSRAFETIIGGIADQRNELLRQWNAFGGRSLLIEGLKFAFVDLLYAIKPVTQALAEVFPPMTAKGLVELTRKFRDLMANARVSVTTFNNIKRTFVGVFSVIKIGIKTVAAFIKGLSPLFQLIGFGISNLLQFTASLGDMIKQFADGLETTGAYARITDTVRTAIYILIGVVVTAINAIAKFGATVKNTIGLFADLAAGAITMDEFKASIDGVNGVAVVLAGIIAGLVGAIRTIGGAIGNVIGKFTTWASTVSSSADVFDKLREKFTFLTPVIDTIEKGFNTLIKAIQNFPQTISDITAKIMAFGEKVMNWASNIKSIPDVFKAIKDQVNKFLGEFKKLQLFDEAKKKFEGLKTAIVDLITTVKTQLSKVDIGTLLTFAFGAALIKLILDISTVISKTKGLVVEATELEKTVKKTFYNIGAAFNASSIIQIATSFTILAGALLLLSKVPPKQLIAEAAALGVLGGEMVALSFGMTALQKSGALENAGKFSMSMAAFAAGVGMIAIAFSMMGELKFDQSFGAKLVALTVIIGELVGASILLSKFVPSMTAGSAAFILFAAAVGILVHALVKIGEQPLSEVEQSINVLTQLIIDISLLTLAASRIRFSSAAGLLLCVASIWAIEKALWEVANSGIDLETIKKHQDKFIILLGTFAVLWAAVAVAGAAAGKAALSAGAGIILAAGSLYVIVMALKELTEIDIDMATSEKFGGNLLMTLITLGAVCIAAVGISVVAKQAGGASVKILAMVAGVAALMYALVALAGIMSSSEEKIEAMSKVIDMLGYVALFAGILLAASALTSQAKVGPIIAMVAGIGIILAGLALLSTITNLEGLYVAGEMFSLTLAAFALALYSASKITKGIEMGSLLSMVAVVGVIATSLYVLANQPWDGVTFGAISLGIVLGAVGAALRLAKDSGDSAFAVLAMTVPLLAAAVSLSMLAELPWEGLIAAAISLGIVLGGMASALVFANDATLTGVAAMVAMSIPLVAAAISLSMLADLPWEGLIAGAVALGIVMNAAALAALIAEGSLAGAAAMVILSASIIIIAEAFKILSTVPFESLLPNLVALGVTLGVITALGVVANTAALGLIALSVAILALGAGAMMFASAAVMMAEAANMLLDAFLRLCNEGPPALVNALTSIIGFITSIASNVKQGLSDIANTVIGTLSSLLGNIVSTISGAVSKIVSAAASLASGIAKGFSSKVKDILSVVAKCVSDMLKALTSKVSQFFNAAKTIVINIVSGVKSKVSEVVNSFTTMVDDARTAIVNKASEFVKAAGDIVQGFIQGIHQKVEEVKNAAKNFAEGFMQGIRDKLEWHSVPHWIPRFVTDAATGMMSNALAAAPQMKAAGEALGAPVVEGFNEQVSQINLAGLGDVASALGINLTGDERLNPTKAQKDAQVAAGKARRGKGKTKTEDKPGGNDTGIGTGSGGGGGGGGGGGSAKEEESELDKLTAKLKDNIDAFSQYENKIGVTGKALLKNLGSWSTGMEGWADRIKFLASEGIDKGLLQKLIDAGPQGAEYVNAFISMTSEELAEAGKAYNESMEAPAKVAQDILALYDENAQKVTEATTTAVEKNVELGESVTDTAKKLGETAEVYSEAVEKPAEAATGVLSSYAEVSGKAAEILDEAITKNKDLVDSVALSTEATESQLKRAQFAYENMRDSLKETIDSQMDIFSEFKTDTELTSDQLIKNMESQLNGVTTWSDELNGLISRGIDEGLLQNLAQMGPKGYEYVHAFSQMTDEELSHASELYRNSLTISDEVSRDIAGKWTAAGLNATLGYKQGIASANANEEATKVGEGSTNSLLTSIDAHSPSRKTHEAGVYFVQGFANGIRESYATATGEITSFAETCVGLLNIYFAPEKFQELGSNIGTGIQNGLNEAITAISTAFDAGGILESYGALGQNIIQGIITGMSAKTAEAVTTVQTMMTNVNTAITGFNPQLNASGVGLITQLNAGMVSLQATVIATGNTIITQTKQKIDSFKQPYFNSGRDLIQKVIDGFKNRKSTVINTADEITKEANQKIDSYQNTYLQTGETLIEKLRTGAANKQQNVVTTVDTLVKAALKAITDTYNDWYAAGQYIIQGLDAGISSMEHIIFEHLQRIAAEAIAAAEEECEIESPSKAFFRIGKFIDLGWVNGIDAYADKVTGAASGLAHDALYTVRDAFSNMASIVSDDISLDPTIRPVLDLTDVENGLTGVDAMLAAQRSLSMSIGGINEEGLRQNRPYVIYLNTSTNLDGQVIATSMDTILGEAL